MRRIHFERLEQRRLLDGSGIALNSSHTFNELPADINSDGIVNTGDFLMLSRHFGRGQNEAGRADVDGDGRVGVQDFLLLSRDFGKRRPPRPDVAGDQDDGSDNGEQEDLRNRFRRRTERFVQSRKNFNNSINRQRLRREVPFLDLAENAQLVFYPVLSAGSETASPPDSPSDRIDPNVTASPFASVGSLEVVHPQLGTFICSGNAITPTRVLTAGHCFDVEMDGQLDDDLTVTFHLNSDGDLSSSHAGQIIHLHPDFSDFSVDGSSDDLAIVELATPIPAHIETYQIGPDEVAAATELEMVGYGLSGHGDEGFTVFPTLTDKRVGANAADIFILDDEGSGVDEMFLYDFDSPVAGDTGRLGGESLGNDIETSVGGGDSGGPAYMHVDGQRRLVGINTFNAAFFSDQEIGKFNSFGGGVLLAPYLDWIHGLAPGSVVSNLSPSFDSLGDVSVLEDAGPQSIAWASGMTANDPNQTVTLSIIEISNPELFDQLPAISPQGELTFAARADRSGTSEVAVQLQDSGGTEYGGQDTTTQTFLLSVLPVNDPPTFSVGENVSIERDSGPQSIEGFASNFAPGPEEVDQAILEFVVSTDNPALFAAQPAIDVDGTLTFAPSPTESGTATVSVSVRDNGGVANGGSDTSEIRAFEIKVDQPGEPVSELVVEFAAQEIELLEGDSPFNQNDFAKASETIDSYSVTADDPELFREQPSISRRGRLRFTPRPNAFGKTLVEVEAKSESGVVAKMAFGIYITPVNDPPSFEIGDDLVSVGGELTTVAEFAHDFDPGNTFERRQRVLEYSVETNDDDLFRRQPSIDVDGTLTFATRRNGVGVGHCFRGGKRQRRDRKRGT